MLNVSVAEPVEAPLTLSPAAAGENFLRLLTLPGHGTGSSTPSLRAPVAQSSHFGLKPFYGHFLDAATTRSMTGARAA